MPIRQGFQVIPVLDLQQGQVVRALRGERSAYQPMQSRLAPGSDALVLAQALLTHPRCAGPAPLLYGADLDAIGGGRVQLGTWCRLLERWPTLTLWLDAGLADPAAAHALHAFFGRARERVRWVFGTESLSSAAALAALADEPAALLSLDSRHAAPIDPAGAWADPQRWPATVIVMTLDRVGANSGPDLALLQRLRAQRPGVRWVGAGGIRDAADLGAAQAAGASAWLVASALHDGRLGAAP